MKGSIFRIFIAENAGSEIQSVSSASLIAGKGIEGDRYYLGIGTFSEKLKGNPAVELSLIEKEKIDHFNARYKQDHSYGDFRRNIVTEGFRLNEYVGKEFTIGTIKLKGIRLCEPCSYLAETVNSLVLPHLVGEGGLRAQIISSGIIEQGDILMARVKRF